MSNIFERLKERASERPPLKAAQSPLELASAQGARLVGAVSLTALAILFLAPFLTFVLCMSKADFLGLSAHVAEYVPTHIIDGWLYVSQIPGYKTPALYVIGLVCVLALAIWVYVWTQVSVSDDLKQIFGPAVTKSNEQGSARLYCDERLLDEITRTWDGRWEKPGEDIPDCAGIVMGYNARTKRFYLSPRGCHTMTIGASGSGKTTAINYNSISALAAGGASIVIPDPKGELYDGEGEDVRRHLFERYGENRVHVIDFRNTARSESINPMDFIRQVYERYRKLSDACFEAALELLEGGMCTDPAHAEQQESWKDKGSYMAYMKHLRLAHANKTLAWSKAEDAAMDLSEAIIPEVPGSPGEHWETSARKALRSIALLVGTITEQDIVKVRRDENGKEIAFTAPLREQRTLESVKYIFDFYGTEDEGKRRPLQEIMGCIDPAHPAVIAFAQLRSSSDKDYATIIAEVQKYLDSLLSMSTNAFLNTSDFDLGSFGEKQQILFCVLPDERPAVGKVFGILVTQMYQALVASAVERGKELAVETHFLLEEFGNLKVTIPDLATKLSMARGWGVYFHLTLQHDKQLKERYGEDGFLSLIANCDVRMLLRSNDVSGVGKYFSEALGVYTYDVSKVTRHRKTLGMYDESNNRSIDKGQRPVLYPDEVCKWDPANGAIVLQANPGKKPTLKARLLGYTNMQPCVYPRGQAWETPTAEVMNIHDKEQMRKKAAIAEAEDRLDTHIPNIPWVPETDFKARMQIEKTLTRGGLSIGAKANLARFAGKREIEKDVVRALREVVEDTDFAGVLLEADIERLVSQTTARIEIRWANKQGEVASKKSDEAERWVTARKAAAPAIVWKVCVPFIGKEDGVTSLTAELDLRIAQMRDKRVVVGLEELASPAYAAKEEKPSANAWIAHVRDVALGALYASSDTDEFVRRLSEQQISLETTKDDAIFVSGKNRIYGKNLAAELGLAAIKSKLEGTPPPTSVSPIGVEQSALRVIAAQGFDTDDLVRQMAAANTSIEKLYMRDPNLAHFDVARGRYMCEWERMLQILQDEFGICVREKTQHKN